RLEGACKQYGAGILISENTYRRLKGTYRVREADRVVVKGKTEPVTIYEVLDYFTEESWPNLADFLGHYRNGVDCYRRQQWDRAIFAFAEALKVRAEDKLSQIYVDRCRQMKQTPPSEHWDGVWILESK